MCNQGLLQYRLHVEEVTTNVTVSTGLGISYPEITDPDYINNAPVGSTGIVISGPVSAIGYIWWKVQYNAGFTGWSVENWLEKA